MPIQLRLSSGMMELPPGLLQGVAALKRLEILAVRLFILDREPVMVWSFRNSEGELEWE